MKKKIKLRPHSEWKKAVKPTNEEKEKRIETILEVISNQPKISRFQLHKLFCKKWDVCWTTIDRYLIQAREELKKRLQTPPEEFKSNAVAFYESIISSPVEKTADRVKAQENLCALLGIKAPKRTELTGADGTPLVQNQVAIQVLLNSLSVDELREIIGKLETGETNGQPKQIGNG